MTVTEPKLDEPDVGSPDDHSHYALKEEVTRAAIEGGFITALCGVKFMPLRDPTRFPICQKCAELIKQLDNQRLN